MQLPMALRLSFVAVRLGNSGAVHARDVASAGASAARSAVTRGRKLTEGRWLNATGASAPLCRDCRTVLRIGSLAEASRRP